MAVVESVENPTLAEIRQNYAEVLEAYNKTVRETDNGWYKTGKSDINIRFEVIKLWLLNTTDQQDGYL